MTSTMRRAGLLLWLTGLLAACSSGSEIPNSDTVDNAPVADSFVLSGHVGNASLKDAQVLLLDAVGLNVGATTSDSTAAYSVTLPNSVQAPLTILANAGEDMINAKAAEFEMRAIVRTSGDQVYNVSPLSTLAAYIDDCSDQSAEQVELLWAQTRARFSLGLTPSVDPLLDPISASNAADLALANEALREILRRSRTAMSSAGTALTYDAILRQIGCDFASDGALNGDVAGVDDRLIATVRAAELSVLIELIGGELYIEGQPGSAWLDEAISVTTGSAKVSVVDVEITTQLIQQAASAAVLFIQEFGDAELLELAVLLDGQPQEVSRAIAETLNGAQLSTLWGLPERMALADPAVVEEIITRATMQAAAAAPVVSLAVSASSISTGTTVQLSWSTAGADRCTRSGDWQGEVGLEGVFDTPALTRTSNFILECVGLGGTTSASVQVAVVSPEASPVTMLSADATTIDPGTSTVLRWTSENADQCTAQGDWSGNKAVIGSQSTGALVNTSTFTMTCSGNNGSDTATVTINVTPIADPTPVVNLSVDRTAIDNGDSVTFSWSSSHADSCQASGAWSGARALAGSEMSGPLNSSSTFTLTCTGTGGSTSASITIVVDASAPLPTLNLQAADASLASGSSTTLTWTSQNASSCSASGDWSGSRAISGSETTGALDANASYTLTCTGPGGSVTASASVSVAATPPTITMAVSPVSITAGETAVLTWNAIGADTCTASGGWSGVKPTSGNENFGPLTQATTFTLNCSGDGGSAVSIVSVEVNGNLILSWQAPTENVDGSTLTNLASYDIYYGQTSGNYPSQVQVADPNVTSINLVLPTGTFYLVMTATNVDGQESAYSNEVVKNSQ